MTAGGPRGKWQTVPLGALAQFRNGINYTKRNFGCGIKVINVCDFQDYTCPRLADLGEIDPDGVVSDADLLKSDDMVLVRSNGNRQLIGRSLYIKAITEPLTYSAFTIRVRFTSDGVLPRFYAYVLRSTVVRDALIARGGGTNISNLNQGILEALEVPLPPFAAQQHIASILSAYDDLIENNTRRIAILEAIARSLYREWFVHHRFPGHENVKMIESPLGPIPEGWEPRVLADLAEDTRRTTQPSEVQSSTPYVGLEHIPRRSIALSAWGRAGEVQSTKLGFRRGEILFGKIRPYFHKVAVAPVDGVCSSDAIVISAKRPEWFPVVLGCTSSDEFVAQATQTANGTKMPRANWPVLLKYPVPVPPKMLLDRFNGVVGRTVDLIQNLIFRSRNLYTTRTLLLPKLISGEIDVSQVTKEPLEATA